MPSRFKVSMNLVEVNCVPLSVVNVTRAARLPEGSRASTACSTPRPDFRHVRLPDLIRLSGFHAAPLFLASCSQTTRAHQQPSLSHHPQHTLAIHAETFFPV